MERKLIMKIQTATNTTTFEKIKSGEVFLYNNEYFMKLDEDYSLNTYTLGGEDLNAVNLCTNLLDGFSYCTEVTLVNGTLMIEN